MLQDFMWTTFEKTGNINAYLSYKEMKQLNNGDRQQLTSDGQLKQLTNQ